MVIQLVSCHTVCQSRCIQSPVTWHLKRVLIYQNNLKLWISIWSNKVPCKLLYVSKLTCIRLLNNCYLQNCGINTKSFSYFASLTDRAASVLLNTRRDVYPITSDTGQVSLNFGNAPAFLRFHRRLQKTWLFQIISKALFLLVTKMYTARPESCRET